MSKIKINKHSLSTLFWGPEHCRDCSIAPFASLTLSSWVQFLWVNTLPCTDSKYGSLLHPGATPTYQETYQLMQQWEKQHAAKGQAKLCFVWYKSQTISIFHLFNVFHSLSGESIAPYCVHNENESFPSNITTVILRSYLMGTGTI